MRLYVAKVAKYVATVFIFILSRLHTAQYHVRQGRAAEVPEVGRISTESNVD